MSFEEKLNIVLEEIRTVHGLSAGEINIIKRNVVTRYNMYKDIKPNINKEETTFIKNTSDFGDILINRLINNIRNYSLSREFDPNIKTKGTYTAKKQDLKLESPASLKAVTLDKLRGRIPNVTEETVQKSVIKVFDHELGHAFQRSFTGIDGYRDSKFHQLVDNLSKKHPEIFENRNNGELKTIQGGMIPQRKEDSRMAIRKFYSPITYTTHLDEIFNDSEATEVVGQREPQFQYDHGNGLKQNIYNYESSYYRVTGHADMMKLLMGKERTYRSMYEDSIHTYEFFDQFINESNTVFANTKYAGKAPMLNVLNALDEAKTKRSTDASLRLDLFFTMCLQKKVVHDLNNPNLDLSQLIEIVEMVKKFDSRIIKSDDHRLTSEKIIAEIKKRIDSKYIELKKSNESSKNLAVENITINQNQEQTVDSNNPIEENTNDINKNDINALYTQIINIIKQNIGKSLSADEKKQLTGKILYYEGYLIEAVKTPEEVYNLLTKIVNDFESSDIEKYFQNILLEDLQNRYSEMKESTSKKQISKEQNEDYSDIKRELATISSRYHEMLKDRTIDDKELNELISRIDALENVVLKKQQSTKDQNSRSILESISETIYEEKRKMQKLQMGIETINNDYNIDRKVTL